MSPSSVLIADYGAYPFTLTLAQELQARDVDVRYVASAGFRGPNRSLPGSGEVRVERIGPPLSSEKSAAARLRLSLGFGRALKSLVREWEPDILLTANVPPEALVLATWGTPQRTHWVWWVQDLFTQAADVAFESRVARAVARTSYGTIERYLGRRADAVVAISEDHRALLPAGCREGAHVVENWAPLHSPDDAASRAWRADHGFGGEPLLMYAGTLGAKHDPTLLLRLAEAVEDMGARVVVVSEGSGADMLALEARATGVENLRVLPFQPWDRVPAMLRAADVLVVILEPDAAEFSVPSKVLSYLVAGRPILGSIASHNLAARRIAELDAGRVSEPGDVEGFLREARALLRDEDGRREMGRRGHEHAWTAFAPASMADRFLAIFRAASEADQGRRPR